ncbi:MAG: PepSY-like domain-containing protein [Bacteroidia bacterium]
MKTTLLVLCLFVICLATNAQKTPPVAVSKAFAEKFKSAEKVKWSMEEATEWEAEFKLNGKEASASFDLAGKWLETELGIEKSELPAAVKDAINKQYSAAKIRECNNIDSPAFTGYEIALNDKGKKFEVQVTKDGKLKVSEESKEK